MTAASECDWGHYDSGDSLEPGSERETALSTKPYHEYRPQSTSHLKRHWPRGVSALLLRMQLQLRHRLGVTVSLPAVPWLPLHRLPHLLFRPSHILRIAVYACLLAPPLLLALVLLYGGVPPSYADVRQREWALPQHRWYPTNPRMSSAARGVRSTVIGDGDGQEMYLRFPDHVWGHGLNNVLQEAILTTHLTLSVSSRTPVFEPYTWSHLPLPYTLYDFTLRPTRVPLSAFVGGVLTGAVGVDDPSSNVDDIRNSTTTRRTRRAVSAQYFEHVCAPSEIVEVVYGLEGPELHSNADAHEDSNAMASPTNTSSVTADTPYRYPYPAPAPHADGHAILAWFARRLRAPDVRSKRCVVVREDGGKVVGARRVFDTDFFGSQERILPVLPELLASPVLKEFAWSPLVSGAVERSVSAAFGVFPNNHTHTNVHAGNPSPYATHLQEDKDKDRDRDKRAQVLEGVLALHLRRGDYGRHCVRLAQWGAGYLGVNGALPDSFVAGGESARAGGEDDEVGVGEVDEEMEHEGEERRKERYYLKHCLPEIEQVAQRLREVRAEYESGLNATSASPSMPASSDDATTSTARNLHRLRHVYVLTNGWPAFVDALRHALLADGWDGVVATDDLEHPFRSVEAPPSSTRLASQRGPGSGLLAALWPWPQWHFRWGRDDDNATGSEGEGAFAGLTREERGVDVGVDMGIAERAEVFVGNGFSSLSANIFMLRMARGFEAGANRLL